MLRLGRRLRASGRAGRHASLDTALGIVGAGWLAAVVGRVDVPAVWWIVLGLSTWLVYAADHLVDGWRARRPATFGRHRLYQRAPVLAIAVWCAGLVAALVAAGALPRAWVLCGVPLAAAAMLHVAAVASGWTRFPKEASTATLYASAVWGPALLQTDGSATSLAALAWLHALAVHGNLSWLAVRDAPVDRAERRASRLTSCAARPVRRALGRRALGAAVLACVAIAIGGDPRVTVAGVTLAALAAWPAWLACRVGPSYPRWAVDVPFQLLAVPALLAVLAG